MWPTGEFVSPALWTIKSAINFSNPTETSPLNRGFSKRVQTHQEVIIVLVAKKDINSMNGLVNVKILTNVNLARTTVQVIFDAKILRVVSYANQKRLPLRQLQGSYNIKLVRVSNIQIH